MSFRCCYIFIFLSWRAPLWHQRLAVLVDTIHLVCFLPAHGLLSDGEWRNNERATQGLPGPPGPPGPPGYSRLFGSNENVTDLVEYFKSKDSLPYPDNKVTLIISPGTKGKSMRVYWHEWWPIDLSSDSTWSHCGAARETRRERGHGITRTQRRERYI